MSVQADVKPPETKDELLAFLREALKSAKDWGCVDVDEIYGPIYASPHAEDIERLEAAIDVVNGLHTTEFVAGWLGNHTLGDMWREEMGVPA